jgi:septum formation protein
MSNAFKRDREPLILASASPRRRQIMGLIDIPFEAIDVDVDETPLPGEAPEVLAGRLAGLKARTAIGRFPDRIVVAADTVVALDGEALGKPADAAEAETMLRRLRARTHDVITGVAVACPATGLPEPEVVTATVTTEVRMRRYTDEEIAAYVATGDPFDKAGSYAIQHPGFHPVEQIEGCYLNVVGFPLPVVRALLRETGRRVPPVIPLALEALCPGCEDVTQLTSP